MAIKNRYKKRMNLQNQFSLQQISFRFPFFLSFYAILNAQIEKWISNIQAKALYIDHVSYPSNAIDLTTRKRICYRHAFEMIELKEFQLIIEECLKSMFRSELLGYFRNCGLTPQSEQNKCPRTPRQEAKTIKTCPQLFIIFYWLIELNM